MASGAKGKMRRPNAKRHLVQAVYAAVTNGYVLGYVQGRIFTGPTKAICVPGLNCYSCPGAYASCPIGALQSVLADRNYNFSFYMVGFFMVIGALLGRVVCGFLCPFGLVQDLLHKIPFVKKLRSLPGERALRALRYVVLGAFVILLPLLAVDIVGQGDPWFCKYICPSGTLFAGLPLVGANAQLRSAAGGLFAWKVALLLVLLFLSIILYRPFCRYLCPLGAVYGLMNRVALYRFRVEESACIHCGACERACPLGIPVYKAPNSAACIRCGLCKKACPTGAITSTWQRGAEKRGEPSYEQ